MKADQRLLALVAIVAMGLSCAQCLGALNDSATVSGEVVPTTIVDPEDDPVFFEVWLKPVVVLPDTGKTDLAGSISITIRGNVPVIVTGASWIKLRNTLDAPMECEETLSGSGLWTRHRYGDAREDPPDPLYPWGDGGPGGGHADELGYQTCSLGGNDSFGNPLTLWTLDVGFQVPYQTWTTATLPGLYQHTTTLTIAPL